MAPDPPRPSRRSYLRAVLATVGVGLSGCLDAGGTAGEDGAADTAASPTAGGSAGAEGEPAPTTGEPTEAPTRNEGAGAETDDSTATGAGADTATPIHSGYETTEVRVLSRDGERLGSVTAAVADTPDLRYLGLSDTESLPEDRGMLFVFESVEERTFVMREMDFGIDIVYADDEGILTRIHHAPAPGPNEDGSEQRYPGRGQYVLEVNYGWTTERGVEAGDRLAFDLPD